MTTCACTTPALNGATAIGVETVVQLLVPAVANQAIGLNIALATTAVKENSRITKSRETMDHAAYLTIPQAMMTTNAFTMHASKEASLTMETTAALVKVAVLARKATHSHSVETTTVVRDGEQGTTALAALPFECEPPQAGNHCLVF